MFDSFLKDCYVKKVSYEKQTQKLKSANKKSVYYKKKYVH